MDVLEGRKYTTSEFMVKFLNDIVEIEGMNECVGAFCHLGIALNILKEEERVRDMEEFFLFIDMYMNATAPRRKRESALNFYWRFYDLFHRATHPHCDNCE